MIITIKNLQQQTFLVDVDPEKTIVELKEQIYNERGEEYPVEKQNLIYAGVILDDEKTIASYNIRSNKFLVVMIKRDLGLSPSQSNESGSKNTEKQNSKLEKNDKSSDNDAASTSDVATSTNTITGGNTGNAVKSETIDADNNKNTNKESKEIDKGSFNEAANTTTTTTAPSSSISTPSSSVKKNDGGGGGNGGNTKENRETILETGEARTSSSISTPSSNPRSVESVLLMGEDYNRMVNSLMEMGYTKEMVERALQASFNNPERAVEYLICGIPSEAADAGLNAAEAAVAAEVAEVGDVLVPDVPDTDADATDDPLEFLRSQPQFVQMRALIQQNPDLLNAVLQQIGLTNPALLQLITENQESFLNMLNEPIEGPNPLDPAFFVSLADRRRRGGSGGVGGGGGSGSGNGSGVTDNDTVANTLDDVTTGTGNNVFQNRNTQDETIHRSSGDGNGDRISEVVSTDNNGSGGGDLRARAAGFAAALGQPYAGGIENSGGRGIMRNDQSMGRTVNRSGGSDGASGGLPTIRLTPQDQAAIERLTALGFPEALVVQAYFACDKNETLAANFLLNTGLDD